MQTSRETTPFLTDTYKAILIRDLIRINECFFNKDFQGSFQGLRMLYSDLLPKPRKELTEKWLEFCKKKEAILIHEGDFVRRSMDQSKAENAFLYENIPEIKEKFIDIMHANNLLDLETGAKPKYSKKGHLSVPT